MRLVAVGREKKAIDILYRLLAERGPEESISHKAMPTIDEHRRFVNSVPYQVWYLIQVNDVYVGSVYISKQREVGVSIFKEYRRKGYAEEALGQVMERWPGRLLANINPSNAKSAGLFGKLGFTLLQHTYAKP